jgi:hypothetical protein
MGSDKFNDFRKVAKYILEIRYQPLTQIFDRRGKALESIHNPFKSKMPQWRMQNPDITISDNFEKETKQLAMTHLRSSIVYTNPATQQEFIDDAKKFLNLFSDTFPELSSLRRIGFRSISIFTRNDINSFDYAFNKIKSSFLHPSLPSSLSFNDCRVSLNHSNGMINIGPTKNTEPWVTENFPNSSESIPDFGYGIDIDSFAIDLQIKNTQDLLNAFTAVTELTFSSEIEVLEYLFRSND